jgi:probable phosphoglycerate mutase
MRPHRPPLYFVRHGETDWNRDRRYQGQTDIPLNATGREQAARNGSVLAKLLGRGDGYDFVSSPLSRTAETMSIVRTAMGLEPHGFRTDPRLMEIHFGHWEGCVWDDLPDSDPENFRARLDDPWQWMPRGGESYRLLNDRVAAALDELKEPVVMVAHGGVSRVLRGYLLGLRPDEIPRLEVPQDRVLVIEDGKARWE